MSSTVFYKNKYILALTTTQEDVVITAAQNLAMVLKGKYGNILRDTTFDQLTCSISVFSQAATP